MFTVNEVAIRCNLRIMERHPDPKDLLYNCSKIITKLKAMYVVFMRFCQNDLEQVV